MARWSLLQAPGTARSLPGTGKPAFVLGDKNFPEEYILGDLYQQALEAQGYKVTLKPNLGSTEIAFKALKSGQIQGYPEYDGTLLATVAGITKNAANSKAAATETRNWAAKHGYTFTNVTPFSDSDAIAVLTSYAKKHGLKTLGDLKKLGAAVKLGGAAEFQTRYPDGLLGLNKIYGASPDVRAAHDPELLHGAGQRPGQRGRGVHHRPAAEDRQVHGAQGHEVHLRLPERRHGHQGQRREGRGSRVHHDDQQGQRAAHAEGRSSR